MDTSTTITWEQDNAKTLARVLTDTSDVAAMQNFLSDVMTKKEIIEISARLQAAIMLDQGKKYAEIIAATKLSSRTVARISDWLQNGTGGYRQAIDRLHHAHLPPARAR